MTGPPNAAQIELLETKYRFETNGDSRKEVHALVKINSELGVRQFARLSFDYNRSFQSVEIPLAHITHANGGTSDILPSAITDAPNPAVEKFPAYHDVRVKSVRILGLQPGDTLEYRIVTTTTKPPLAPDFWLSHSFDRTGVVTDELFEIDLPAERKCSLDSVPDYHYETFKGEEKSGSRIGYRWKVSRSSQVETTVPESGVPADIVLTTFDSWLQLSLQLGKLLIPFTDSKAIATEVTRRAEQITANSPGDKEKLEKIYYFVSRNVLTVDLPLGATDFQTRPPEDILTSGYATPEDKFKLFHALSKAVGLGLIGTLSGAPTGTEKRLPTPTPFSHPLIGVGYSPSGEMPYKVGMVQGYLLDPALEVAPFGAVSPAARKSPLFVINPPLSLKQPEGIYMSWMAAPSTQSPDLLQWHTPAATQSVKVDAQLLQDGSLKMSLRYFVRGDTELLLRVAFHKTPTEKQNEIAQYLALSDGFRGKVTSVKTSDPYDTDKPFEVEYELTQEKFVDWLKKPVLIPALLPLPGLPELPKKSTGDSKIELGSPLDIELSGTLRLPPGVTAQAPVGTSAKRDYATFTSQYSTKENVIHFSRHLNFLLSEIPGARAVDLGAFLHAVQSDQSQLFVLDKSDVAPPAKPK